MKDKVGYITGLINESVVDGPGFRYVIFLKGCSKRCPTCHNEKNTWNFDINSESTLILSADSIISGIVKSPILSGVTMSGGEPFQQIDFMLDFAEKLLLERPKLNIVYYTGYYLHELLELPIKDKVKKLLTMPNAYLLKDGPFIRGKCNLDLYFRGSTNQRIIDLQKTKDLTNPTIFTYQGILHDGEVTPLENKLPFFELNKLKYIKSENTQNNTTTHYYSIEGENKTLTQVINDTTGEVIKEIIN